MIGELNVDGVFVPTLLVAALIAFGITTVTRLSLRQLRIYRFVWHAGLFDVALFVVVLWVTAMVTEKWTFSGVN